MSEPNEVIFHGPLTKEELKESWEVMMRASDPNIGKSPICLIVSPKLYRLILNRSRAERRRTNLEARR
jgi:hypothetical protein